MRDLELAVLFRNNHFSTIFKRNGKLYALATDLGFADVPAVVWEEMVDVRGNAATCSFGCRRGVDCGHGNWHSGAARLSL
jgi:hypothetical protein